MNTKDYQLQSRRFLRPAVKALSLFASILILGSFATSHAQKRSIVLSPIRGCEGYESAVQVSIEGVQMKGNEISVLPGTHNLSVVTQKDLNLIIKEIKYEDAEVSQDGTTSTPKPQSFTPNTPDANVSITVYSPGPLGRVSAQMPARLIITVACGVAAPQNLPIIFLPGVAGTKLLSQRSPYRGQPEVWPMSVDQRRAELGLKEDGITPAIPSTVIIPFKILIESPTDYYSSLISFLKPEFTSNPLRVTQLLRLFPYDWRLDNAAHFAKLDEIIDDTLIRQPSAKKVILLAHSMGGIIARAYILSKPARAAKVDSLITMGTPYWGTPKPYYGVVSGYTFGNPTVRQELMKILAQNFPAAYQLMPNYQFILNATNRRMLTLEESSRIKYKWFTDVTPGIFKDKYDETADNSMSFNSTLVNMARDFNDPQKIGTRENPKPLPAGVKHYVIIGTGVKTLKYFIMREFRLPEKFLELDGRRVVIEPDFGDGDGTVPLQGSEISPDQNVAAAIATTYYIPYVKGWLWNNSSAHGDLPANTTVQEIVGEIIDGKPPDPNKYKYQQPGTELRDLEKGVDFTLHSDAHLSIADESTGRKLGFNNQGGIDEDLPSGTFLAMEGVEYASIADTNRTLGVTVAGIQDGKFTLDVNIKRPGGAATQFSYREVPVKKGTIARVTLTPGQVSAPPPLTVTTDGRTTTIPASIGTARGPVIPQGGFPPVSTAPIPAPPSSGGIGGTWTTPSGDTITLTQDGNRVTGTYRGILGTGTLSGTFDGRTVTGTIEGGQGGITVRDTFSLRLTPEGRLEGRLGSSIFSVDVILTRRP